MLLLKKKSILTLGRNQIILNKNLFKPLKTFFSLSNSLFWLPVGVDNLNLDKNLFQSSKFSILAPGGIRYFNLQETPPNKSVHFS